MSMVGTRVGRDVPLEDAKYDEANLLTPNPRLIATNYWRGLNLSLQKS